MGSLEDKQQALQNTQALMAKVMEAAATALTFAKDALSYKASDVAASAPKAEMIRLGAVALSEGAKAATVATDLSMLCVEMVQELEDIYSWETSEKEHEEHTKAVKERIRHAAR